MKNLNALPCNILSVLEDRQGGGEGGGGEGESLKVASSGFV